MNKTHRSDPRDRVTNGNSWSDVRLNAEATKRYWSANGGYKVFPKCLIKWKFEEP